MLWRNVEPFLKPVLQHCAKKEEGQDLGFNPLHLYYEEPGTHEEVLGWGRGVQNPCLCTLVCVYIHTVVHMQTARRGSARAGELMPVACTHLHKHLQLHTHISIHTG